MGVALTLGMSVLNLSSKNLVALLVASFAVFSVGCAGGDEAPQYTASDLPGALTGTSAQALTCESGTVQNCTIWLGQHGDLSNCAHGVDVCAQGEWTGCIDEAELSENPDLYASLTE
ncbi:MAG: hypothetical protein RL033_5836 [Pseudomonadota bacterium]|jgi:hypothetical protein